MKMTNPALLAVLGSALGSFPLSGCHTPEKPVATTAERIASVADFERLKMLSGDWYLISGVRLGVELEPNLEEPLVSYVVGSEGRSVVEKCFVGGPEETTSVYYLDSGRLMMDHRCSQGHQTRMVASSHAGNQIDFRPVGMSDPGDQDELHLSFHALVFDGPNELTAEWGSTRGGVAGAAIRYTVERPDSGR